jgi:hypothetical protein
MQRYLMYLFLQMLYMFQQNATLFDAFIFTNAIFVSGGSSAHHQEHTIVHTDLLTICETVCTVMCS